MDVANRNCQNNEELGTKTYFGQITYVHVVCTSLGLNGYNYLN